MRRRTFIAGLGSAAVWPVVARAQQPTMPVIGFLSPARVTGTNVLASFSKGLSETGFIEGQNMAIEYRFANNAGAERLKELAADLVRRRVTVIAATGLGAALAAKAATATIPIVFRTGNDPVRYGLVASFNRPGGNVTGINDIGRDLAAKRLGLLHEVLPEPRASPHSSNHFWPLSRRSQSLRRRLRRLEVPSRSSRRAPVARSTRPLRASCKSALTHSGSVLTRCSRTVVCNWSRWRHITGCPQSILGVSTLRAAA